MGLSHTVKDGVAGANRGLPPVAVYQLVLDPGSHLLYAATHGRGIYRLEGD